MTQNSILMKIKPSKFHFFLQGKWLLYLTDMPEVTPPGVGECFVNPRYVNALGLRDAIRRPLLYTNRKPPKPYNEAKIAQKRKKKRRKRSIVHSTSAEQELLNVIQSYEKSEAIWIAAAATSSLADIILDCADPEVVQCHTITCRIHGGLRANESAVVSISRPILCRYGRYFADVLLMRPILQCCQL